MKLRVATYNIHKGVMGLRQKVRIHGVRLALAAIDADIVFLQEVQDRNERMAKRKGYPEGTQLDYLCTGAICTAPTAMTPCIRTATTATRSCLATGSACSEPRHLRPRAGEAGPAARGVAHRRPQRTARHPPDQHALRLIKRSRVRQAEFLVDFVRSEVPPDAPLIIAGDFNDWQRSPTRCCTMNSMCSRSRRSSTAATRGPG